MWSIHIQIPRNRLLATSHSIMLGSATRCASNVARAVLLRAGARSSMVGCSSPVVGVRFASGAVASPEGPIGIVMLNMGGPSSLHGEHDGVGPFLHRLFSDGEIIRLGPLQKILVSDVAQAASASSTLAALS